eukprot:758044-Hanusia_phi.AAC.2
MDGKEEEEDETVYFVPAHVTFRDTNSSKERSLTRKLLLRVSDDALPNVRRVRLLGPLVHPQVFQVHGIDHHSQTVGSETTLAFTVVLTLPDPCENVNYQDWIHALDEHSQKVHSVALRAICVGEECNPHDFFPVRPPALSVRDFFHHEETPSCIQTKATDLKSVGDDIDPEDILNAADALLQECDVPVTVNAVYQENKGDILKTKPTTQQWSDSELAFYQSVVHSKNDLSQDEGKCEMKKNVLTRIDCDRTSREIRRAQFLPGGEAD